MAPPLVRCPECEASVDWEDVPAGAKSYRCPSCGERVPLPARRSKKAKGGSSGAKVVVGVLLGCGGLLLLAVGGIGFGVYKLLAPTSYEERSEDYAAARRSFQTKLTRQGPAPQEWEREPAPPGVAEVEYASGNLRLRAWMSAPRAGEGRKPGVVFLHGGFAFGDGDWDSTRPFRDAGYAGLAPMVRGENGLPGSYSMFFHEVDDVLAAAEFFAGQPHVDPERLYVCGHSVGGTLTLLAAMTSNRFRAAASFSGSPDQVAWARGQAELVPFDPNQRAEFDMRSPLAFPGSFKCPTRVYYGEEEIFFRASSQKLAERAKALGRDVEAVSVPGDHLSMIDPAARQAIAFFRQHEKR